MSRAEFESIAEFLLKRLPVERVRNVGDGLWEMRCVAALGGGLNLPFVVTTSEDAGTAEFNHALDFVVDATRRPELELLLGKLQADPSGITPVLAAGGTELRLTGTLRFGPDGQPAGEPDSMPVALVEALAIMGPVLHAVAVEGLRAREALAASSEPGVPGPDTRFGFRGN